MGVESVTSGYSDGRVAARLAASAVSMGEPKTGQRAGKPNWSAVEERQGLPSAGVLQQVDVPPPPRLPWPAQTSAFSGGLIQDSFLVASGDWPVGVSAAPSPARRRCVLLVKTLG